MDLSLTLPSIAPTMQPESSDGFASVGTILPEEGAALLPGGSFRFLGDGRTRIRSLSAKLFESWAFSILSP